MNYSLLKELLEQAEEFERLRPTGSAPADIKTFAAWLHGHTAAPKAARGPSAPLSVPGMTPEAEIGKLLLFLTRYARSYIRQGLAGTPLLTPDDFAYLATVLGHQPLSKTELIARNVHEKPSGNEVIKRLLARGLVQEQPHATDRRSKLLTITETGQGVLFEVFGRMEQASQLIAGNLTAPERAQLLYLLQKLDAFHQPIYANRPAGFQELLQWLPKPEST
ncbi:MarR family winged helix-turn-helix transcriptional regulator [Hymenobacter puniceus]|uniref:MarR family winged helix-turn-helix transcriptional regulator n=1 Tax=Hymenobacter sp. BT190 TaxID=2763505 RepID=UPI001650FBBD|nr:MarR family winged helix-turn-helix transcriptional regulator [Hymenobacter sp. BT190]MBC6699127.1 winged helix-turn-helix transcriptional regulator [Hymenobacter sp. BT190]